MPTLDIRSGQYEFRVRAPAGMFGTWNVRTLNTEPTARVSARMACGRDGRFKFHWKKNMGKLNAPIQSAVNHALGVFSSQSERADKPLRKCRATGRR
jgi:hypothetical protein